MLRAPVILAKYVTFKSYILQNAVFASLRHSFVLNSMLMLGKIEINMIKDRAFRASSFPHNAAGEQQMLRKANAREEDEWCIQGSSIILFLRKDPCLGLKLGIRKKVETSNFTTVEVAACSVSANG